MIPYSPGELGIGQIFSLFEDSRDLKWFLKSLEGTNINSLWIKSPNGFMQKLEVIHESEIRLDHDLKLTIEDYLSFN